MKEKQRKADVPIFVNQVMVCLHNFQLFWQILALNIFCFVGSMFRFRVGEASPSPSTSCAPADQHKLTNLIYFSVFIRENILNSSLSWSKTAENNPWYRLLCFSASYGFTQHFLFLLLETLLCFVLYFINCKRAAAAQIVPIFFFFWVSLLLPIVFTWLYSPVLYSEFLLSFCF